jgi:hypothetical protein
MDILEILNQAVDVNGVKVNVNITTQSYIYLGITGVAVFAIGSLVWHLIGKQIKAS